MFDKFHVWLTLHLWSPLYQIKYNNIAGIAQVLKIANRSNRGWGTKDILGESKIEIYVIFAGFAFCGSGTRTHY